MAVSIMKYLACAFGAVFLVIAIASASGTRTFLAEASPARGTVTALVRGRSSSSNSYAPVVRFVTADGETIEFKSNTFSDPPAYAVGQHVDVLYRPLAPSNAMVDDFLSLWASPLMFGALGSIFLAGGVGFIAAAILRARKAADLKRHGRRVMTTVQRVERNDSVKVQGRNPYRIFTVAPSLAGPDARVFESDDVWFDPSPYLNGREITVYVDRHDRDRYYVDLSFLERAHSAGPARWRTTPAR
jgi:hypothetical protein